MGRSPWPVCSQPPRPPPCIPQGLVSSSATDVASGNRPTGGCKKAHPGPEHAAEAGSGPRNPPRSWDRAGKFSLWLSWHRVWDGKLYPRGTPQGCHFWWTQTVRVGSVLSCRAVSHVLGALPTCLQHSTVLLLEDH